jgi:hypothetical protein
VAIWSRFRVLVAWGRKSIAVSGRSEIRSPVVARTPLTLPALNYLIYLGVSW